jgi:glyoxylase-like metal-dependent hydrolase (beta-lactamase superfamily II)
VGVRIDRVVTSGSFTLDAESSSVETNVWLIGDDTEVLVVDPAHDVGEILRNLHSRNVIGIVCTHGHSDHIDAAIPLAEWTQAPLLLHPVDLPLWDMTNWRRQPDVDLQDGQEISVGGVTAQVLHTPGHSQGSSSLWIPELSAVITGDTLLADGPGATGRRFSDFPTIIDSISHRLLSLPGDTIVHPGHGPDTTIGEQAPRLDDWVVRGH